MQKTCLSVVCELAREDPNVVFVGSDLRPGAMMEFKEEFPERFFMEGIMEQNAVGMAAGMALEGLVPYVNTIAAFLVRRAYEQLAVQVCLGNLPVRLIGNGAGFIFSPLGPTHTILDDIAILRALPNMTVIVPADIHEARRLTQQTRHWPGPVYLRMAKGKAPIVSREGDVCKIGQAIVLREGADVGLIATGIMVHRALVVAENLSRQGVECAVLNVHTIKPLDEEALLKLAASTSLLVTLEEHSPLGGLAGAVAELVMERGHRPIPRLLRLGTPDHFSDGYGSQDEMLAKVGLDSDTIQHAVWRAWLLSKKSERN
ncbi:MAG: transketolase [Magnetococcales bacterium]|nr:transketolase [Magnetococcales bacterium]